MSDDYRLYSVEMLLARHAPYCLVKRLLSAAARWLAVICHYVCHAIARKHAASYYRRQAICRPAWRRKIIIIRPSFGHRLHAAACRHYQSSNEVFLDA